MESILEIRNLSVGFSRKGGWKPFLKHIDLSIPRGKTLGVVGESGSGKSLLCLSVMRLLDEGSTKTLQGEILLNGNDLVSMSEAKVRRRRGRDMAMIFQEPMTSLNPVLTVGYQIAEVLQLHKHLSKKESWNQAVDLMNLVGIERSHKRAFDYPHQLSGGQRQRVMIAMAVACEPALIIADEPTTALDMTIQRQILDLLQDLQDRYGMSMLFVSHDLGVVANVADRVCIMKQGQVMDEGDVSQVFRNSSNPYTKALVGCRISAESQSARLPVLSHFISSKGEDLNFDIQSLGVKKKSEPLAEKTKAPLVAWNLQKNFVSEKNIWGKPKNWKEALKGVNFDVHADRILGIVGESGSGKTTLGRLLVNLIEPTSGQVTFEGKDIFQMSSKEVFQFRKQVQIIFQDPYASLNPRKRVGEAIVEPLKIHKLHRGTEKVRALALIEKVGMSASDFEKFPHELSGGERQRVCIARALSLEPQFIVCDEPVSSLDVSVRGQVLNLLLDLKSEFGLSYIFISHDLELVKYFCDDVLVLSQGRIVESGSAESVFLNPKTEYTKNLIHSIPKWEFGV